jgi:hypothetical protein
LPGRCEDGLAIVLETARQRGGDDLAERVAVVLGGPFTQRQQVGAEQRRVVEHAADRPVILAVVGPLEWRAHDDAGDLAAAERHAHAHAGPQARRIASGNAVIKTAVQRHRHGDAAQQIAHGLWISM